MAMADALVPGPALNDVLISRLARDLARSLFPQQKIRESYRLTTEQFEKLLDTEYFRTRLQEEIEIWHAATPASVLTRIQAKSATLIEDSLVEVYTLIHDRTQPLAAKVEALKWAARMAGAGENQQVRRDDQERIRFNIYIDNKKVVFDKEPLPPAVIDGSATLVDKDPNVA
jgi:hypothetical protein